MAPRILPRMVDDACAGIVQRWLEDHGVAVRTGATVTKIEQVGGKRKLSFKKGEPLIADVVIMATGIRTNLEWLEGSGIERRAEARRRHRRGRPPALERQERLRGGRRGARART